MRLTLIISMLLLSVGLFAQLKPNTWAEYKAVDDKGEMSVDAFRVDVQADTDNPNALWVEIECAKPKGEKFVFKYLFNNGAILRYALKEGDEAGLEYWDKHNEKPLLPVWGFTEHLIPQFEGEGFSNSAQYLGWKYNKTREGDGARASLITNPIVLNLNPSLMIGTWFQGRDDRTYRRWDNSEYDIVNFTRDDFAEMMNAGFNYMNRVSAQDEDWFRVKPVFYTREYSLHNHSGPRYIKYPEILYRSNMLGVSMFIDEPAVRFPGECPEIFRAGAPISDSAFPQAYAKALETFAAYELQNHIGFGHYAFQGVVDRANPPIQRAIPLYQADIPAWETTISASWYIVNAGAKGVIQEGRWNLDRLRLFNAVMEVQLPVNKETILKLDFATLRGAGRVFKTNWGSAVYGQADPEIARESVLTAYNMGARHIWFWNFDHNHHVPYDEQLNLTRLLMKTISGKPKRDMSALRNSAQAVIVLPYGYTLTTETRYLFNNPYYHLGRKNNHGKTYRQVLHAAALEIERCVRDNIDFDVVIQHPNVKEAGYKEIIEIGEDASVRINGTIVAGNRTPEKRPARSAPKLNAKLSAAKGTAPLVIKATVSAVRPGIGKLGAMDKTYIMYEIIRQPTSSSFRQGTGVDEIRLEREGEYLIRIWGYDEAGASAYVEKKVTVLPSANPQPENQQRHRRN